MKKMKIFDHEKFKEAVVKSGMKIDEIANAVHCPISLFYKYLEGKVTPRPQRILALTKILGPNITTLNITLNENLPPGLSREEKGFLAWFRLRPYHYQQRILALVLAVCEFGNEADAEFAAEFAEQLSLLEEHQKEQKG